MTALIFGVLLATTPRSDAAFSADKYQALAQFLRDAGQDVGTAPPRHVDGELILPKSFRVALAQFLGHDFHENRISVASDGEVSVQTSEPQPHRFRVRFGCRHPGFSIQWRPGGGSDDYAVVGVKTDADACIVDAETPVGALFWRLPKGRDQAASDALGMLREMYVQGN